MPFTPAHAVVALPFVRTPLVPAAIAVGAMMPDLPLYVRFGPGYWVTHELWAILPVDVPIALGLLLVWRVVLRPAVPELVPLWYARRVPAAWLDPVLGWWETWGGVTAPRAGRARAAVLVLASLALGVLTHIVWDAFTHESRWGSAVLPMLATDAAGRPLWEWFSLASSTVGLTIIVVWLHFWCVRQTASECQYRTPAGVRIAAWTALPVALVLGGFVVATVREGPEESGMALFLERSGTAGAAIFLVALVLLALGIRVSLARHARDAA